MSRSTATVERSGFVCHLLGDLLPRLGHRLPEALPSSPGPRRRLPVVQPVLTRPHPVGAVRQQYDRDAKPRHCALRRPSLRGDPAAFLPATTSSIPRTGPWPGWARRSTLFLCRYLDSEPLRQTFTKDSTWSELAPRLHLLRQRRRDRHQPPRRRIRRSRCCRCTFCRPVWYASTR